MNAGIARQRKNDALLTDFYPLTMAHAYFELGMRETAVFELFVRRLPPLTVAREHCRECLAELPQSLRGIEEADVAYPVHLSQGVRVLAETLGD